MLSTNTNISTNEEKLVKLLKSKDRRGFEILYDRYSGALYGVILKVVRIEEIAQDVLQDSFVKIWKKVQHYDASKGTLFTWILNIARNTAIDKTRSKAYKQQISVLDIEKGASMAASNQENKSKIDFIGVDKEVAKLKPEYRQVIDYIYFKGYTHAEAAEALNLPLGTVKTRVRTAIQELRKLT